MGDPISTFTGAVASLSFDERVGACQATIISDQSVNCTTTEPRMQTLLETAWIKGIDVTVDYEPSENNQLVSVSLNSS